MDPQTIFHVQTTWQAVAPIAPKAAELFYANLFAANPSLRNLFKGDMTKQGEMLMTMINTAVNSLDKPNVLIPVLQSLGKRHKNYSVQDEDYATVGGALLKTLEQGLGDAFTQEVKQAWTEVYQTMAKVMLDAAKTC